MRNLFTGPTGPEFLFLFSILTTIIAAVCWWRKWDRDTSRALSPLPPPKAIDPYELAYFRAGDNELTRVLILKLVETRYLRIAPQSWSFWKGTPPSRIEKNPDHPPVTHLTPIELEAFEWFDASRTATDVFRSGNTLAHVDPPSALSRHTLKYERKLRAERLLTSDESRDAARRTVFIGIAIIAAIVLARLFISINRGPLVGFLFLILMGIAGIIAIAKIGRAGRLSRRGRDYLEATQGAWLSLKDRNPRSDWSPTMAASVFGHAVLAGTEMDPVNEMFARGRHKDYWGGAGGCGAAGGCGGGGCGGGCGGCGGCGG